MNGKIYIYFNRKKYEQTGEKTYYVGQTIRTLEERAGANGCKYMENPNSKFCRAINKWGWDAFEGYILIENIKTIEELNQLEIEYIKKYDSYNNGYNSTLGGGNLCGYCHTEETKQKISESRKGKLVGEDNPMFGVTMSEESRKKMSEAKKGKSSHMKGKHHTEETKQKISETKFKNGTNNKGVPHSEEHTKHLTESVRKSCGKAIYCPQLDMTFETMSDAKKFLKENFNINVSGNISSVLNGRRLYAGTIILNGEEVNLTWLRAN